MAYVRSYLLGPADATPVKIEYQLHDLVATG